jgi:predicted phage gp36 major capsid-like protein
VIRQETTSPSGPSKNEVKKRQKELEKQKRKEEAQARREEQEKLKAAMEVVASFICPRARQMQTNLVGLR